MTRAFGAGETARLALPSRGICGTIDMQVRSPNISAKGAPLIKQMRAGKILNRSESALVRIFPVLVAASSSH